MGSIKNDPSRFRQFKRRMSPQDAKDKYIRSSPYRDALFPAMKGFPDLKGKTPVQIADNARKQRVIRASSYVVSTTSPKQAPQSIESRKTLPGKRRDPIKASSKQHNATIPENENESGEWEDSNSDDDSGPPYFGWASSYDVDPGTRPNYTFTKAFCDFTLGKQVYKMDESEDERSASAKRRKLADSVSDTLPGGSQFTRTGFANNTGAECYRSSLFQALCNSPKFVSWLLGKHPPERCCVEPLLLSDGRLRKLCISCLIYKLVSTYWNMPDRPQPHHSMNTIQTVIEAKFRASGFKTSNNSIGGQGDPNDLFNWIFEAFAKEFPTSALDELDAICNFTCQQVIYCPRCDQEFTRPVKERALSLNMVSKTGNAPTPFSSYLKAYMDTELLDYRCHNCEADTHKYKGYTTKSKGNLSKKRKFYRIISAPDILAINLRITKLVGRRTVKDTRYIPYPQYLDLSQYCDEKTLGTAKYELYSVIYHVGTDNSGHYVNISKKPGSNIWMEFNDEHVRKVGLNEALRPSVGHPFMLFYQRTKE